MRWIYFGAGLKPHPVHCAFGRSGFVVFADGSEPNIPESGRIVVVLELDENFRRVRIVVISVHLMRGIPEILPLVMEEHTIVDHGHVCFFLPVRGPHPWPNAQPRRSEGAPFHG